MSILETIFHIFRTFQKYQHCMSFHFNPLMPKKSAFDEQNRLALDRVKSSGARQSKIYRSLLGSNGLNVSGLYITPSW